MGVGKTSVSRELLKLLPRAVMLDGDWCWYADPFTVTDETRAMVTDNIVCLLGNFLSCTAYENVIFCWVMHEKAISESILSRLDLSGCRVREISLVCSPAALSRRLERDIKRHTNARRTAAQSRKTAALRASRYGKTRCIGHNGTPRRGADSIVCRFARNA